MSRFSKEDGSCVRSILPPNVLLKMCNRDNDTGRYVKSTDPSNWLLLISSVNKLVGRLVKSNLPLKRLLLIEKNTNELGRFVTLIVPRNILLLILNSINVMGRPDIFAVHANKLLLRRSVVNEVAVVMLKTHNEYETSNWENWLFDMSSVDKEFGKVGILNGPTKRLSEISTDDNSELVVKCMPLGALVK
jgi:hypothetical protein